MINGDGGDNKCNTGVHLVMFEKLWIGADQLEEFGGKKKNLSKLSGVKRNFKKRIFSNFSISEFNDL